MVRERVGIRIRIGVGGRLEIDNIDEAVAISILISGLRIRI